MPQIKYHCQFDTWDGFMDGEIIVGNLHFIYDFVAEDQDSPDENDVTLTDFSEEGARQHFAANGINDIQFVYDYKE